MSETQFTPGPWAAHESTERSPLPIGVCIEVGIEAGHGAATSSICEMVAQGDGRYDPSVTNANAYLIAAAPDLYAMLDLALDLLDREHGSLYSDIQTDGRKALAKARGEV